MKTLQITFEYLSFFKSKYSSILTQVKNLTEKISLVLE